MRLQRYHRNVYLMLLFTLGKGLQLSIAALTTNLYIHSLGYKSEFIGLVTAMPAIGSFAAAVPTGLLADRWGRKPLLILSGLLNPLALAATALSTSAPLLLAAGLVNGVLAGGYWVTNLPILTESTNEDQRVGVLAINSFLLLGIGALGSLIGGLVPALVGNLLHVSANSTAPLRWGLLTAAIVILLPALPLLWIQETPRSRPLVASDTPEAGASEDSVPRATTPQRSDTAGVAAVGAHDAIRAAVIDGHDATRAAAVNGRTPTGSAEAPAVDVHAIQGVADPAGRRGVAILFLKLLIPDALFNAGQGAVIGLLQIYMVLRFHVGPDTLGLFYTVAGLTGGATSLLSPRLVRRWGRLRTAVLMQYLTVPAMLLTGFAPVFALSATGEFTRTVLRGFFDPVYSAFAMESVSQRLRATLSGLYSTTWSIGFTTGPAIAGVLQQQVSLSASFLLGAACVAVSATLLYVFFAESAAR